MSHFVTGPEFTRPFVNLPAKWFVEGVLLRVRLGLAWLALTLTSFSQLHAADLTSVPARCALGYGKGCPSKQPDQTCLGLSCTPACLQP